MAPARIAICGTGGTIAMEGSHDFDWVDYGGNGVINPVAVILERTELAIDDVELVPVSVRNLASTNITPADWIELARTIDELLTEDPGLAGVVVTHGTASLEETAFFLDLVHRHAAPVVVTGAQRPPNTVGSDAIPNLRAAIAACRAPELRNMGVLVAMHGYVHAARDVTKLANHALDAFASPEFGPLARVEADGTVTVRRRPFCLAKHLYVLPLPSDMPRVDISFSYAGADGVAIDAYVAQGARGLILAGFAPGRSTAAEQNAAAEAVRAGVVLVQASRALSGVVPLQRYSTARGILSGGELSPQKSRILLMLALAVQMPVATIQQRLLTI
jgi:L-asparaginase